MWTLKKVVALSYRDQWASTRRDFLHWLKKFRGDPDLALLNKPSELLNTKKGPCIPRW